MKINVTQILKNYEGDELKNLTIDDKQEPFTLRAAISMALNGSVLVQGRPAPITAENKAKIYQLCSKLFSNKNVDFTVDDMAFIKEQAKKVSEVNPLVCGRLCEILEVKDTVDK